MKTEYESEEEYTKAKKQPKTPRQERSSLKARMAPWKTTNNLHQGKSSTKKLSGLLTPVRDRIGPTNREKIREAQKTKSAKERLGTRPLDKDGRRHGLDRIRPAPETNRSKQSHSVRTRSGNTNLMPREAQRKSRNARDRESTRQDRPSGANSKAKLRQLTGQSQENTNLGLNLLKF